MTDIDAAAAELLALTEHVTALHVQLAKRNFIMPRETRARLERAATHLAARPATDDAEWIAEAAALSAQLRGEVPA